MNNRRRRVLYQFELDAGLRRALRHRALDLDMPAAEVVRRAVAAFLDSPGDVESTAEQIVVKRSRSSRRRQSQGGSGAE
jgi:hypothetical protein